MSDPMPTIRAILGIPDATVTPLFSHPDHTPTSPKPVTRPLAPEFTAPLGDDYQAAGDDYRDLIETQLVTNEDMGPGFTPRPEDLA